MINGRILMTPATMDRIIVEMLTRDPTMAMGYLSYELSEHCAHWHFSLKDRRLLQTYLEGIYHEAYKFFDKPIQSGT